ncbi:MAG: hypothetical protein COA58_04120 [Bacteroidetes bacterium]|nr:MAG: hypothetical protein COA58_04120 [Bacteroidota bacterium]
MNSTYKVGKDNIETYDALCDYFNDTYSIKAYCGLLQSLEFELSQKIDGIFISRTIKSRNRQLILNVKVESIEDLRNKNDISLSKINTYLSEAFRSLGSSVQFIYDKKNNFQFRIFTPDINTLLDV